MLQKIKFSLVIGKTVDQVSTKFTLIFSELKIRLNIRKNTWFQIQLHITDDGLYYSQVLTH
jgi:hypothetical protein